MSRNKRAKKRTLDRCVKLYLESFNILLNRHCRQHHTPLAAAALFSAPTHC